MALKYEHLQVAKRIARGKNGTQAYLEVYPNSSVEAAGQSVYKLLKKAEFQAAIEEERKKLQIQDADIIRELKEGLLEMYRTDTAKNTRLKTAEILAKMTGAYSDTRRLEMSGSVKVELGEEAKDWAE